MGKSKSRRKRKKETAPNSQGMSPGTLVFVGDQRVEKVTFDFIWYNADGMDAKELPNVESAIAALRGPGLKWLNISGLHDISVVEKVGHALGLDKLVMEDILNTSQRPKLESHDHYLFVELQDITFSETQNCFAGEQVSLIMGKDYVVSFQERKSEVFEPIRRRVAKSTGNHRRRGTDYLLYTLVDAVVDHYFAIIEKMGDRLDLLEEQVIAHPGPEILSKVYTFKRELIEMRRAVYPLREVVSVLERTENPLVNADLRWFIRDLYDHTIQVIETLETYRDSASGLVDLYMSSVSNRMNNVMKVLTVIATIFIPLTFIAGVYGMNFEFMPGIHDRWGFWVACTSMVVILLIMLGFFKWKKWV
jgi:magnesium transporter